MSCIVDAHQHFWTYGTYQTSWMEAAPYAGDPSFAPLRRSFEPGDLEPELRAAGIQFTVAVQAAGGDAENNSLLAAATSHPWIAGIVGWVPLDRPDVAARMLDELGTQSRLVGIRHLINVEPDPDWILQATVLEGLRLLERRGLAFDYVGILPRHLAHVPVLAERLPGLRIVIDHLAKPPITAGSFEPWASQLAAAAAAPNVYAKLSGLDAGDADHWSAADLVRWADHALRCFGPERLMFGSDWPVCLLRGGYAKVWRETQKLLSGMSDDERAQVLGGAAITAYRLTSLNLGHRLDKSSSHRGLYHPNAHPRQSAATSPVSKPVPGACWHRCLRRPGTGSRGAASDGPRNAGPLDPRVPGDGAEVD